MQMLVFPHAIGRQPTAQDWC